MYVCMYMYVYMYIYIYSRRAVVRHTCAAVSML